MRWLRRSPVIVGLLLACGVATGVAAQGLAVAAASDLQTVLPQLAATYQRDTGERVRISFGSSGQFVAQIQNGAPFDVFLSADDEYVARLVASGQAIADTAMPYARGRLALWTRRDSGHDISAGLGSLRDARIRRVAIANPEHAPYGRAAVAALRGAGLYDQIRPKLVLGENVAQAAQFARTGSADVALIAVALARSRAMDDAGTTIELPSDSYPVMRQSGVVLARGDRDAGRRFLAYLTGGAARRALIAAGFGAP